MLGRISIRLLVPVLMGLPVIVAAVWLVVLWSGHAQRTAQTLGAAEVDQVHGRISERLNALLGQPGRITQLQRRAILSGRLPTDDIRAWREPLFDLVSSFSAFSGFTWGEADGDVAWVFLYPGKDRLEYAISDATTFRDGERFIEEYALDESGLPVEQIGGYAYDPRERPWFIGAVEAGEPTFLDPYAWMNLDGQVTTLGVPFVEAVYDEAGSLLGVLTAEFSLARLSAFLRSLDVGFGGFILILDSEGRLLAHSLEPEGVPLSVDLGQGMEVLAATESENALVRGVARSVGGAQPAGVAEIDGRRMLLRESVYRTAPGLNWRVVTAVPEDEVLAPVAQARSSSDRATAVAVGLTLLLGMALGVFATWPVSRLVRDIRRVGEGELNERVETQPSRELREVAEAVNAMAEDLKDRVRLRESLLVAMEVQNNLLPQESPTVAGLDVAGHSTYCDETGGDYYDYLDVQGVSQSGVALAIGDVMGHGVAAAMLMATARGILRSRCHEPNTLGDLLTHMNELLVEDTGGQRFMTMQLVMLDGADGAMAWASAGHDPPMVYRAGRGAFDALDGGGLPLGLFGEQQYSTDGAEPLQPGDVVVLATDGLWEAKMDDGEFYGKERLEAVIREAAGGTAEAIAVAIRSDHRRLCGGHSQADDITFVVAKRLGAKAAGG